MDPKFEKRQAVFAKMKGYPHWPARILDPFDETPNKKRYYVLFYGTRDTAICKTQDLCSYVENRDRYGKKRSKSKKLNQAIEEMDKELGLTPNENCELLNQDNVPGKHVMPILKIEKQLVDIMVTIQRCLSLHVEANTDECLKQLDILYELEINSLMLKKHPEIVQTMTKLEKYVGNIKLWSLSQEQSEYFLSHAKLIRCKAEKINNKFKQLFNLSNECSFIEHFNKKVEELRNVTNTLSLDDFFLLISDPTEMEKESSE